MIEQEISLNGNPVKVIVKEVIKVTSACVACTKKKRKCDGKIPCSSISLIYIIINIFLQ